MNQLEFSPISEKQQQSIDAFSFFQNTASHIRKKSAHQAQQATLKIFEKLSRILHNRQSYSFQLLKQFILFSSDQETIEIHYKYTQYELEQGVEYLENSYGLNVKLTLVKAFQDIRNFANKKKVYQNKIHVASFVNVFENMMKAKKQLVLKSFFKILTKFIEDEKNTQKQKILCEKIRKQNEEKLEDHQQQSSERLQNQSKDRYTFELKPIENINIQSIQSKLKKSSKSSKFQTISQERQKQYETNKWRQQVEDINSFEAQPVYPPQMSKSSRMLTKSMSHQLPSNSNANKQHLDLSRHKNTTVLKGQPKFSSAHNTPNHRNQNYDVFETKRRYEQSLQMSKQQQLDLNAIQNVIIIRSAKKHKREPDRYIRVPITSQQVKIIELIPDQKQKRRKKYVETELQKNLQTLNSKHRQKSESNRTSQRSRKVLKDRQFYIEQGNMRKSKKYVQQKIQTDSELHQCLGCKYCQFVKQMQAYRLQRTSTKPISFI